MTAKAKVWTSLGTIMGIVIGGLLGTMIPSVMITLGFIGDAFLGGLTVLSFVMVATTLVTSVSGLGATSKFRHAFFKNLGFWGITLIFAVAIAIGVGQFILTEVSDGSSALDGIRSIPGTNSGTAVFWLGSILLAIGMGLTAIKLKIRARSLMTWFKNLGEGIGSLTELLSYILPVGIMFAIGNYVARDGYPLTSMSMLAGNFVLSTVIGLAVLGLVVMPLILTLISGVNPLTFYGKLLPAILAAFGTMSSRLALPFVITALESDRQTDKRATGLAVSFGTVFNVAPTVLVVILSTIFMANVTGASISMLQLLLIGVTAAGLSIGVGSGVGMIVPVIVGAISLTGDFQVLSPALALIVGVTWLLEPIRAAFTTMGDGVGAAVLSQAFEFKTALRSPARTAPRRFGSDRSDQSSQRGRRPDRTSSRGRSTRSESSSERPARGRSQGTKDGERRQSSDKDRSRGRDQKDSRVTKSGSRATSTRDSARDQRKSTPATRGSAETKDAKETTKNSPFSMGSGGDPALEMNPPVSPSVSTDSQSSGRSRSPRRDRPARKPERRTASSDSNRGKADTRSSKESAKPETGEMPASDKRKTTDTSSRQSDMPVNKPLNENSPDSSQERKSSLTKSRIEGELARVSEQLRRMDDRLEPVDNETKVNDIPTTEPTADPIESKPAPVETTPVETKPVINDQPSTENLPVPEPENPVEESEPVEKAAGISDEEKKLAASFGRSKDRGQVSDNQPPTSESGGDDSSVESTSESAPPVSNADTTEKAKKETEFGRSKRKKRTR